ncbi:MAG: hypothetical protein HW389_891, partial [Bacteroidetes bacterium]|nr:hypothetical protein [Bacteroidota bacterium]
MKAQPGRRFLRYIVAASTLVLLVLLLSSSGCPPTTPVSPVAQDPNYRFFFRQVGATSPVVDGLMTGDGGWTGSSRFNFEDGGTVYAAFMHCIAEPDSLSFYFEVEDMSFNSEDVIVIGIHSGAGTNDYQRLHIYPFTTGAAPANGSNLSPASIEYYDQGTYSSSTGWSFQSTAVPAGVKAKVATATGAYLKWSVEVKIPVGAPFNIPASDYFGMYVDVARTDDIDHPTGPADAIVAIQWTWPPERIIGSIDEDIYGYVESGTPAPTLWGNASRATTIGNGVFIMSSDISTNQDDPSKISLNQDNIFTATPHNNSANASGTLTTATDVKATFKIANFGLPSPSAWALIPTGGPGVDLATVDPNPTAAADIPPTGTVSLSAGPWHLSVAEATTYAANLHKCVKVELSSTDASTVFFNSYAYRNMDFVTTSSPFERTAQV